MALRLLEQDRNIVLLAMTEVVGLRKAKQLAKGC